MMDPEVSSAIDGLKRQAESAAKDLAEIAPRLVSVEAALKHLAEREAQRLIAEVHDKVSALGTALEDHIEEIHQRFDAVEIHVADRAKQLYADVAAALKTPRALAIGALVIALLFFAIGGAAERHGLIPDLKPAVLSAPVRGP